VIDSAARAPRPPASTRVLVAATSRTSFIDADVAILERHYRVETVFGSGPAAALRIAARALAADVSVSWFASVYTVALVAASKAARRRSLVVLGGVDTARDPSIGYGIWTSRWRRPLLRWALRRADRILAVDRSLIDTLSASSGLSDLPIDVLPTGYDSSFWTPGAARSRSVLAVAGCRTAERTLVKGVDRIVETARAMPDVPFTLVGTDPDLVAPFEPPRNLALVASLDAASLRERYRDASVFCLASRHEGLPNALCEAMLCGCVPVATRVGGVADTIGEAGELVAGGDVAELVSAVRRALEAPDARRAAARARIVERYPIERRESRLVEIIEELRDA
jgi:glycosyltransferase involved in cell wall biosynthesis